MKISLLFLASLSAIALTSQGQTQFQALPVEGFPITQSIPLAKRPPLGSQVMRIKIEAKNLPTKAPVKIGEARQESFEFTLTNAERTTFAGTADCFFLSKKEGAWTVSSPQTFRVLLNKKATSRHVTRTDPRQNVKIDGWMVRVVANGFQVAMDASSPEIAKAFEDPETITQVVENAKLQAAAVAQEARAAALAQRAAQVAEARALRERRQAEREMADAPLAPPPAE